MATDPQSDQSQPEIPSSSVSPIIPVVEDYPYVPSPSLLTPAALETLIQKAPEKVLEFVDNHNQRQYELAKQREENRVKAQQDGQTTLRMGLGLFCGVFAGILVYAGVTGDKALPDRFITLTIGALGGGAGVTLLKPKDNAAK